VFATEHLRHVPPLLTQSVLEGAIFNVLEGPNEVLGHRAAIDLVAGLRSPTPPAAPSGTPPLRIATQLAAAFHERIEPVARSAEPLSVAPVQEIADLACAAWATACGAAWLGQPALPARTRDGARDAVAAFGEAALRLIRHRMAGAVRAFSEEEN
jgi:hypothetical protein